MISNNSINQLIKKVLTSSKIVAMVGISFPKDEKNSRIIKRRPSIIVMEYLKEFGYKVIPVNPNSAGKKINGELVYEKLEDIPTSVDIVNVFRPSKETPEIAKQAVKIKAKTLWLQFGIDNLEAKKIVEIDEINYIANKCIKQEYQKSFLKISPVFPVLQ
jgi:uncharacterized protein